MKVKVKHGLVKFRPLSISLGPITSRKFYRDGKMDVWTYSTHIKSLKQLQKEASGSLKLSVPIANINNRTFKVWFVFGAKDVSHSSTVVAALNKDSDTNNSANTATANSATENSNSDNENPATESKPQKKAQASQESKAVVPKATKPQFSPKKSTYADISLIRYPFLPVIATFIVIDGLIIAGAIILRKKVMKGSKKA